MVARLTPDQKVACSIHVGFNFTNLKYFFFVAFVNGALNGPTSGPYPILKLLFLFLDLVIGLSDGPTSGPHRS